MKTVVGVFAQRSAAEHAATELHKKGVPSDRINVLSPDTRDVSTLPPTETEQSGTGAAIGGVVGAAAAAAGGLSLTTVSIMIPGIGPVVAAGVVAAAILGLGCAMGGAVVGSALEQHLATGIPKDEVFVYQDALRQGRSVVVVFVDNEKRAEGVRATLIEHGAESLDAAHRDRWIGLSDVTDERYEG